MYVKQISFHNFLQFKEATFEFSSGLNLIYGPNEAGKTSLLKGIKYALFGPKSGIKERKATVTIIIDHNGQTVKAFNGKFDPAQIGLKIPPILFENIFFVPTGELDFKEPRKFFSFLKEKLLDIELLVMAKEKIRALMGKELAPLKEKFLKTGTLEEEQKRLLEKKTWLEKQKEIYLRIRHLNEEVLSSNQKAQEYQKELKQWEQKEATFKILLKKKGICERLNRCERLKEIKQKERELQKELAALEAFTREEGDRLMECQEGLQKIHQKREALKQALREIDKEIEGKRSQEERINQEITSIELELERLRIGLEQMPKINKVDLDKAKELLQKMTLLQQNHKEYQEKISQEQSKKEKLQSQKEILTKNSFKEKRKSILISLILILDTILLVATILQRQKTVFLTITCLLGIGLGYLWWRKRKHLEALQRDLLQTNMAYQKQKELLEIKEKELEKIKGQINLCLKDYQALCQELGVRNAEELDDLYGKRLQAKLRLNEAQRDLDNKRRIQKMLRDETLKLDQRRKKLRFEMETVDKEEEKIKAEIFTILHKAGVEAISIYHQKMKEKEALENQLKAYQDTLQNENISDPEMEIKSLKKQMETLKDIPDETIDERELQTNLEKLKIELDNIQAYINQCQGKLKELERQKEMAEAQVFNELYLVEEELKKIEREKEEWLGVYQVFLDIETEAETVLGEILNKASAQFAEITAHRWQGLKIKNGQIQAISQSKAYPIKALSTGTKDQLYLAVRLALAQEIIPEGLFLLLDDPFLTWDKKRTMKILKILEQIASKFQILLATKEEWLKETLSQRAHVINLTTIP